MAMEIRQARAEEAGEVQACARAAYRDYIASIGKEPAPMVADFGEQIAQGIVWVLADGEEIAGYVVFYLRGDHMLLENVAVDPAHQGAGHGRRLIAHVEQAAIESFSSLQESDPDRVDQLTAFIEANQLVERNVAGGLNGSLAFYKGLVDGGGFEMPEDQILQDVWSQEPEIRDSPSVVRRRSIDGRVSWRNLNFEFDDGLAVKHELEGATVEQLASGLVEVGLGVGDGTIGVVSRLTS